MKSNDKKLGIMGGMGSHASVFLYSSIINKSPATKDNEFIEIIIHKFSYFIFSNKPDEFIGAILDNLGVAHFFDEVIGQYRFPEIKPNPRAIRYLMERYDLGKDDVMIVGDHSTDIEAGKNAGIRSVFCSYGLGRLNGLKADRVIGKFGELLDLV